MTSDYSYWRAALNGDLETYIDVPQVGFWRRKWRSGISQPIAIWPEGDELKCLCAGKPMDPWKIWGPFLKPTTEAEYRQKRKTGQYSDEFEDVSGGYTTDVTKALLIEPPNRRHHNGDNKKARD